MRCKELQAVLEEEGLGPLPLEAQGHLAECPGCQDFLADLSAIVTAARQFPAEVNPPDRVWISLRAQLAAEGIIREEVPVGLSAKVPWWPSISQFFQPRMLASVGAGVLVVLAGAYFAKRPAPGGVSLNSVPAQPQIREVAKSDAPPAAKQAPLGAVKSEPVVVHRVSVPPSPPRKSPDLRPSPSENAFLGEAALALNRTENDLPGPGNAMADAAMRANLRTLNEFIAECKDRLAENPQDRLTREYLNVAYQQKAELLSAMMDSGRSEH